MTTTEATTITNRAMLVRLSISNWRARKYSRNVSDQVNEEYAAEKEASRVNKHLFAGDPIHKALCSAADAARVAHYTQTLPWEDGGEGWRLLPTSNWIAYADAMRVKRADWMRALDAFVDAYPDLRAGAEAKLGKLYDARDYPDARRVRERFDWAIDFSPVPDAGDLRVDLPAEQVATIAASVSNRLASATAAAMEDAWARLREAVARIKDRTADPKSPLRGNLIAQARETVEILGRLNLTQDARLDEMREMVERELTGDDVESLRENDALRAATAVKAGDILAKMSAFYGTPAA